MVFVGPINFHMVPSLEEKAHQILMRVNFECQIAAYFLNLYYILLHDSTTDAKKCPKCK